MTRTYITAADGTIYEAISARTALRRKIINRTIAGITILITALFLSAAIIGLQRAAIEGAGAPHTAPTAAHITTLPEMQRACRKAPKGAKQDCYALYLRRAWADPRGSYTAAGPLLVRDCISQYRGAELADCFTQEIG
jgi:hypothetical protein